MPNDFKYDFWLSRIGALGIESIIVCCLSVAGILWPMCCLCDVGLNGITKTNRKTYLKVHNLWQKSTDAVTLTELRNYYILLLSAATAWQATWPTPGTMSKKKILGEKPVGTRTCHSCVRPLIFHEMPHRKSDLNRTKELRNSKHTS